MWRSRPERGAPARGAPENLHLVELYDLAVLNIDDWRVDVTSSVTSKCHSLTCIETIEFMVSNQGGCFIQTMSQGLVLPTIYKDVFQDTPPQTAHLRP